MARGILSEQLGINKGGKLSSRFVSTSSKRPSRTDRIKKRQIAEKLARDQKAEADRIERLRAKAKAIQDEQFKTKYETYTATEYKGKNDSWQKWAGMQEGVKQRIIDKNIKYGDTYLDSRQVTKTREIPFSYELTGENTYTNVYDSLDPELKSFFLNPTEAKTSLTKQQADLKASELLKATNYSQREIDKYNSLIQQRNEAVDRGDNDRANDLDASIDRQKFIKEQSQSVVSNVSSGWTFYGAVDYAQNRILRDDQKIANTQAYKDLIAGGSSFAPVYQEAGESAGISNINWSDTSNLSLIRQNKWLATYGGISQTLVGKGKLSDPTVLNYKKIIGDTAFSKLQTDIKSSQIKQVELGSVEKQSLNLFQATEGGNLLRVENIALPYQTKGTQLYKDGNVPYEIKDYTNLYLDGQNSVDAKTDKGFFGKVIDSKAVKKVTQFYKDTSFVFTKPDLSFNPLKSKNIFDISYKDKALSGNEIVFDYGAEADKTWQVIQDWQEKKSEVFNVKHDVYGRAGKDNVEKTLQDQYNLYARDTYSKQIVEGTFDDKLVQAEFMETTGARGLMKIYGEDIALARADTGTWSKIGYGAVNLGAEITQFSLKGTSRPVALAGTTVAVTGAVYGLGAVGSIPYGSVALTGAFTTKGFYDAFNPLSSPEKAGAGFVTGVIGASTLGYGAYRWGGTPVVKRVKIKVPKGNWDASSSVGRDMKLIYGKDGKVIERVIFNNQKLSQQTSAGYRTTVTTKGSVLRSNFMKEILKSVKLDTKIAQPKYIYKGVYGASGTKDTLINSKDYGFFRTNAYIKQGSYNKALNRLKSYGWSDAQAKQTLRYTQPKIVENYLEKGILKINKDGSIGSFTTAQKQPVVTIDKQLGIKTRGAREIRDYIRVERKLVEFEGIDKKFVLENQFSASVFKDSALKFTLRDVGMQRGLSVGGASESKAGYDILGVDKYGAWKLKPTTYKDLINIKASEGVKFSFKGANRPIRIDITNNRFDITKTILSKRIIDLSNKGVVTPKFITKTPLSKTFGTDPNVKNAMKSVRNVMDKIDDAKPVKFNNVGSIKGNQVFAQDPQIKQLQSILKSPASTTQPVIKTNIRKLIKVDTGLKSGLFIGSAGSQGLINLMGLKGGTSMKTDSSFDIKFDTRLKDILKTGQVPISSSATSQVTQLKTTPTFSMGTTLPPSILKDPVIKPNPIPKPFVWPYLEQRGSKKKKKKSTKRVQELLLLPDFTTRALGLKPKVIKRTDAMKEVRKILSGFELRKGVKFN